MTKAHKHAELMKFAADHWHVAEWRYRTSPESEWSRWNAFASTPVRDWIPSVEFEVRLIRRTAIQPRREVPAPEREAPPKGTRYWTACSLAGEEGRSTIWDDMDCERECLAAGLVYLNKEDRDARVAAMLELEKGE